MDPASGRTALLEEDRTLVPRVPRAAWESSVTARNWGLHVERGPNWLFIRVQRCPDQWGEVGVLAECVVQALDQHMVNRVVLELRDVGCSCERLVAEVQRLDAWLQRRHGVLRICGVPARYIRQLRHTHFTDRYPLYEDREDAVWGGARCDRPR